MKALPQVLREVAVQYHGDQQYDSGPYVREHLDRVVEVLGRFGYCVDEFLAAGYGHDLFEDTELTPDGLEEILFTEGYREEAPVVIGLIDAVTNRPGKNRRERHLATYKITKAFQCDYLGGAPAVAIKLADRIANVEASLNSTGKSFFGMYRKEHDFFRAELRQLGCHEQMWEHLDFLINGEWKVK